MRESMGLSVNASNAAPVRLNHQPKSARTELGYPPIHRRCATFSPPSPYPFTPSACRSVGNTRHPAKTSSGTVQNPSSEIILPQQIRRSLTRCVLVAHAPSERAGLRDSAITVLVPAAKVWCIAPRPGSSQSENRMRLSLLSSCARTFARSAVSTCIIITAAACSIGSVGDTPGGCCLGQCLAPPCSRLR